VTDLGQLIDDLDRLAQEANDLERRREAAEQALLDRMAQAELSKDDLADVYLAVRHSVTSQFSQRWNTRLPTSMTAAASRAAHRGRRMARAVPNGPGGAYWTGTIPLRMPDPMPMLGTAVVYVLYDNLNQPCYLGSTSALQARLACHLREGRAFVHWMAIPCQNRKDAYDLEAKMLKELKLPMNKAG
jgi:predicted GIY-YIG superfamily endonuclease